MTVPVYQNPGIHFLMILNTLGVKTGVSDAGGLSSEYVLNIGSDFPGHLCCFLPIAGFLTGESKLEVGRGWLMEVCTRWYVVGSQ